MIRINLAPEQKRRRGVSFRLPLPSFNLGLLFGVLYVLAVVGIGAYWWSLSGEETKLAGDVDRKSKELATLKTTLGQGSKVKDLVAELRKRVDVVTQLTKNQARPIALVDVFASAVPRDLWITALEERNAVLRVSGTAFSTTAVYDFMANLRSSGRFQDVDIVVSRRDLARPTPLVTFEVTCRFEG
ncbi:MAG: PilN domain-containing protein [Candidatus Rokubacteria bacterium]|nr:PilN domain-containing protein [Candidatus Rokubacteria bacterium]